MADRGSTDEPKSKKLKTEPEIDSIFREFRKDKERVETLRGAFLALYQGWRPLKLSLLKVKESNARISESFSRASIYTTLYTDDDGKKRVYQMGEIFKYGMAVLKEYLDEEPKIPKEIDRRNALAKLLKFISHDHDVFFQDINYDGKEGEWAITVAQHLLSPLAVANGYIIDSYPGLRTIFDYGDQRCPCGKDDLVGRIGDTTFGCEDGWHGPTDILMDEQLPVSVEPDDMNLLSVSSATEINTSEKFSDNDHKQIVAQTIVFSFLQQKENKEILNNLLVPGIEISVKNVVAYFYDCEEDVLLTTVPMLLKEESPQLDIYTVVFLWLTLNYKHFCSGVTDDMKCCKAEFFEVVGTFLDVYRNTVKRPVHTYDHDKSKESRNAWVQKQLPVKNTNEIGRYGIDFMKVPM